MSEFTFKVNLIAVVRVRAADESVARQVVPTVCLERPAPLKLDWPMRTMLRWVITQL
jgi:hypothetical protein